MQDIWKACTHTDEVLPQLLLTSSGDNILPPAKLIAGAYTFYCFIPGLTPGATIIPPILGSLRLLLSSDESRRGDIMVELKPIQRKNPEGMELSFAN